MLLVVADIAATQATPRNQKLEEESGGVWFARSSHSRIIFEFASVSLRSHLPRLYPPHKLHTEREVHREGVELLRSRRWTQSAFLLNKL